MHNIHEKLLNKKYIIGKRVSEVREEQEDEKWKEIEIHPHIQYILKNIIPDKIIIKEKCGKMKYLDGDELEEHISFLLNIIIRNNKKINSFVSPFLGKCEKYIDAKKNVGEKICVIKPLTIVFKMISGTQYKWESISSISINNMEKYDFKYVSFLFSDKRDIFVDDTVLVIDVDDVDKTNYPAIYFALVKVNKLYATNNFVEYALATKFKLEGRIIEGYKFYLDPSKTVEKIKNTRVRIVFGAFNLFPEYRFVSKNFRVAWPEALLSELKFYEIRDIEENKLLRRIITDLLANM